MVSFDMQFKSNHLIRQIIEIQSLELHFLWDFSQTRDCTFYETEYVLASRKKSYIYIYLSQLKLAIQIQIDPKLRYTYAHAPTIHVTLVGILFF